MRHVPAIGIKDVVAGVYLYGIAVVLDCHIVVLLGKGLIAKSVHTTVGQKKSLTYGSYHHMLLLTP